MIVLRCEVRSRILLEGEMQSVPQIVRERLKNGNSTGEHPDANLLAAFAEKSLSDRERAHVLTHLSQCGDCRDVVALALPDTDTPEMLKVPERHGWMSWPAFRWGFVTAGVLLIGVGALQYQRRTRPDMAGVVAKRVAGQGKITDQIQPQPPPTSAEATPAQVGTPKPPGLVKNDEKREQQQKSSIAGANGAFKAPNRYTRGTTIDGPMYGPKAPMQWQQQQQTPSRVLGFLPAPSQRTEEKDIAVTHNMSPLGAQNQTVVVAAQAPQAGDRGAGAPAARAQFDVFAPSVSKTKPAAPPKATQDSAAAGLAASARWSINSAGGLQRSFDGGGSWQDIDVLANSAPEASSLSGSLEMVVTNSAAKQKSADKRLAKKDTAPPVFRAVAADGHEVWAGGSNGVLYHSADDGSLWTRVTPYCQGNTPNGDIVSVQLSDLNHVTITTSIPEIWSTNDGGHTWQKQ